VLIFKGKVTRALRAWPPPWVHVNHISSAEQQPLRTYARSRGRNSTDIHQ
jgi:hypothetical protein